MVIYYTHKFTGAPGESHKLLDRVMTDYCGYSLTASEELVIGEFGKPSLPGADSFSISHSENTWVLFSGVGLNCTKHTNGTGLGACGIDVQYTRHCNMLKLAKRWYHPAEYKMVASVVNANENANDSENANANENANDSENTNVSEFFRIWARREALVKAVGNSIVTSDLPSTLDDEVEYEGCRWRIRDVEIPGLVGGYAAVCYPAIANSSENNKEKTAEIDSEIEMKEIEPGRQEKEIDFDR